MPRRVPAPAAAVLCSAGCGKTAHALCEGLCAACYHLQLRARPSSAGSAPAEVEFVDEDDIDIEMEMQAIDAVHAEAAAAAAQPHSAASKP